MYACNGEIYNWQELNKATGSESRGDCIAAAAAISRAGLKRGLESILGEFALIQIDLPGTESDNTEANITIARDTYGVRPMFWGLDNENRLLAVSSMEGVPKELTHMFSPLRGGTWLKYSATDRKIVTRNTYTHTNLLLTPPPDPAIYFQNIFIEAVRIRCAQIEINQKIGVLLSGGADSVAMIAAMSECIDASNIAAFTVCFGDIVTPDMEIACEVCINLGIGRHEVLTVPENALTLDLLRESIRSLHTFDTTTIRAGTIQHLLYKLAHPVMQEEGVKAVLSGEGADELAGGYQYFKMAPDALAAETESNRLLSDIFLYDGLRADRTAGAWGKEVRLPFLDVRVVDAFKRWLSAKQRWDPRMEKRALRSLLASIPTLSFKTPGVQAALRRPKDALSDSVGKRWVEKLKVMATVYCEGREFPKWEHCPPRTKEEKMYRSLFDEVCGAESATQIPYYWMPKWQEVGSAGSLDPSATVLPCFQNSEGNATTKPSPPQGMQQMSFTMNPGMGGGGMPPNMGGWVP
jgi:asparagine synthase (glutamine-hydrolysing)